MLKSSLLVKPVVDQAVHKLAALLAEVPAIRIDDLMREASLSGQRADILAYLSVSGRRHTFVCEVKESGQPRFIRMALFQLRAYVSQFDGEATPILIAPYLSPKSQGLCRQEGVGFLDFEGNARIAFDGVFIERQAATKPLAERRELKSFFKPKSAQVLTMMLRDPGHPWRVVDLAAAANVSLGHVSNVRAGLLHREWGRVSDRGLLLSDPDALLDAWRDEYELPPGRRITFYTTLHGARFEDAARKVLHADSDKGRAVFASFSAAQWQAPYARSAAHYFYADEVGLQRLESALQLSSAAKGENVMITIPKHTELFRNAVEPAAGAVCTGPVQTYLDLSCAGERGREAADHLRRELLTWPR